MEFCLVLKFVECPSHEIKCSTNENYFTVSFTDKHKIFYLEITFN